MAVRRPYAMHHQSSVESFYSCSDSTEIHTARIVVPPMPQHKRSQLHLDVTAATKMTPRHQRYHSDEEMPSPGFDDEEERDYSAASSQAGDVSDEGEIDIDDSIDLDRLEVLPELPTVHIVYAGHPSLVDVARLAPMQPRRHRRTEKQQQPPVPIPRRSSRRRAANRSISMYEAPAELAAEAKPEPQPFSTPQNAAFPAGITTTKNFSTPHRIAAAAAAAARPRPTALAYSVHTTPNLSWGPSSPDDSEGSGEADEDDDEAELLLRESAEIQVRTRSSERERQMALSGADGGDYDDVDEYYYALESPTPTSYEAYDPYGMEAPRLLSAEKQRRRTEKERETKGWKGLVSRRGRRDAIIV